MSETFEKVLVKDDRLGCITPKVKFQVFKGGQNITSQTFKAISETKASHVYNVTVPSLETVISREVLWKSTVTLKITMVDPEEFAKYDSMTPTALDYLAHYTDGVYKMPFQLERDGTNVTALPPGATDAAGSRPQSFLSFPNNILSYDMNRPAGTAYYHKPRGAWKIQNIYALAADGARRVPLVTDTVVYVTFEVTEPLLLSPFVFGSGYGKQGFYGIQTMNFQMNMNPTANRAWRSAVYDMTKNVEIESFNNSQLIFQFLTPHASDMLDPRNVVPFYELPVYRTSSLPTLTGRPLFGQSNDAGAFVESPPTTFYSTNIQLSGIPDKLIIFVRKPPSTLNCGETDSYATIKGISIKFNNQAGLLS